MYVVFSINSKLDWESFPFAMLYIQIVPDALAENVAYFFELFVYLIFLLVYLSKFINSLNNGVNASLESLIVLLSQVNVAVESAFAGSSIPTHLEFVILTFSQLILKQIIL